MATVCPPVVEYSREFQARAADELDLLPEGSALAEMLANYSVMRIPMKPAIDSETKPATCSDFIAASIPI